MSKIGNLLSRRTSSNYFLPEVDGFRFFAISTVVLYHLNTVFSRSLAKINDSYFLESFLFDVLSQGSIGVDVFFAISGFILALPFARQHFGASPPVHLGPYFIRRLTRLEPPYVISMVIFLAVHVVILHENFGSILPNFISSLFYVHSVVYNEWSVINPVAWSLEVEVQFYLLAPLLTFVFAVRNTAVRRAIILFVIVVSIFHYNLNYEWIKEWHLRKSLFMHLHQFFIGFLMADIFLVNWNGSAQTKKMSWDGIGLVAMASLFIWNEPFHILDDVIFCGALLLTFISVFKGKFINQFYTHPAIVIIGGMCYTIYLLHYAAIAFLSGKTTLFFQSSWSYAANYAVQAVLVIPAVLLVSAVFFVLIERPCMDKDWPIKFKRWVLSLF